MGRRDTDRLLTRRRFLEGSLALAGAATLSGTRLLQGTAASAAESTLYVPPVVWPTDSLVPFDLRTQEVASAPGIGSGAVLAYNGSVPGPTFEVRRGQNINVVLHNELSVNETITHWHGMEVPHVVDGHPAQAIQPGEVKHYDARSFVVDQRATMNWYHPHPHGLTGEQVALGLAGALIIRDDEEDALRTDGVLSQVTAELPLVIRDAEFDSQGDLVYRARSSGYLGNVPLVNGVQHPVHPIPPGRYRLRILVGTNARVFRLAFSDGSPFPVIGNDGGFLERIRQVQELQLSSAERVDVLVDFEGSAGDQIVLRDLDTGWDLITFELSATGAAPTPALADGDTVSTQVPAPLLAQVDGSERVQEFSFDGMRRINGLEFAMDDVPYWIPRGAIERWRFTTGGNGPHPVHIHGTYFQVVEGRGGRRDTAPGLPGRPGLFPWEDGWKDTVLLQDGETVDVLIRFDKDYGHDRELYLMHCHKLEHEDNGMMTNFEVLSPDTHPWQPVRNGPGKGRRPPHP